MEGRTAIGGFALGMNGLVSYYPDSIVQTTCYPEWDKRHIGNVSLYHIPSLDKDDKHIRMVGNSGYSNIRIPTAERAITDYIRYIDLFEDSFLLDGIEEYGRIHNNDFSKLEEVAEEYGILDKLHYYINYAYETSSDGE